MQLSALQIVLLVLVAAEINVDRRGLSLTHARPVIVGFLCGLILGDMNSGLYIGCTFTLMSLGVAALGGSSVPDYGVATIIACAFAKTTGQGPEVGMTSVFLLVCWAYRWTFYTRSATPSLPRNPRNMPMKNSLAKCMLSFTFALLW